MNSIPFLFYTAPLASGIISAVSAKGLTLVGLLPDKPNERSLHGGPTPRSGGIGVLAGIILGTALSGVSHPVIWIASGLGVISLVDDRWNLPALLRLLMHFAAAIAIVFSLGPWPSPWMIPLLILGLVWMTNSYNFMDGADGLAGGMTTFGFGAYAIAAGLQGHTPLMMLALCTAAAAAGFLLFNFPPARIFIGDVGSVPLGLLAGAVGLMGWRAGIWPLIFPLVVFAPFGVDATVTLLKRVFRRERIWKAHREHYYQRLILSGWTHRRLAIAEYAVMLICAISGLAIVFVSHAGQVFAVAALGLVLLCLMLLVDRRWQSYTRTDHV